MGKREIIDCVAFGGKLAVELSNMEESEKEEWRYGIDAAATILKKGVQESPVAQQMRETARQYDDEYLKPAVAAASFRLIPLWRSSFVTAMRRFLM